MKNRIPPQLQPSALLWSLDLSWAALDLKQACLQYDRTKDMDILDGTHIEARTLQLEGDDHECAVILVCLADRYHEAGMPERADECSDQAVRCLSSRSESHHEHNYAVALYSLGLARESLGAGTEAASYYDAAIDAFTQARMRWIRLGQEVWRKQCETAIQWLRGLRGRLAHIMAQDQAGDPPTATVPVLSRVQAGTPNLADQEFHEWLTLASQYAVRVDYALRVQGDSMVGAGLSEGDMALFKATKEEPQKGGDIVAVVVDQPGEEATLKRFYREPDHVRLEPANADHPYLILKPPRVSEEGLRAHYKQKEPGRELRFYSGTDPHIVGWLVWYIPKNRVGDMLTIID